MHIISITAFIDNLIYATDLTVQFIPTLYTLDESGTGNRNKRNIEGIDEFTIQLSNRADREVLVILTTFDGTAQGILFSSCDIYLLLYILNSLSGCISLEEIER